MGRVDGQRGRSAWLFKIKGKLKRHAPIIKEIAETAGRINPALGAKMAVAKHIAGTVQDAAARIKGAANQKQ
jgi:hypothetical protein